MNTISLLPHPVLLFVVNKYVAFLLPVYKTHKTPTTQPSEDCVCLKFALSHFRLHSILYVMLLFT